jgi:hypothetical protein
MTEPRSSVIKKKATVNQRVADKMNKTDRRDSSVTADFTIHITEAGEEVRTTTRICKGFK